MTKMESISPKQFVPFRWRSSCVNSFRGVSWHSAKEKLQPSRQHCANSGLALGEVPKPSSFSTSSSTMIGHQEVMSRRWLESKLTKKTLLGLLSGGAVPNSLLPKHAAVAGWKHRALSPLWSKKDFRRCLLIVAPEQGEVDGPLECSLEVGMVAGEARLHVAVQHRRPVVRCRATFRVTQHLYCPIYRRSTQLMFKLDWSIHLLDLDAAPPEWRVNDVRLLASVTTAARGSITRGAAVGDHLLAKADVIRGMHERVQLCQDLQTEFALLRESLGAR